MIKKHYEIPDSELIFVKAEDNFLTSPTYNPNGVEQSNYRDGEEEDLFFS